jgi:hypothetical protein
VADRAGEPLEAFVLSLEFVLAVLSLGDVGDEPLDSRVSGS